MHKRKAVSLCLPWSVTSLCYKCILGCSRQGILVSGLVRCFLYYKSDNGSTSCTLFTFFLLCADLEKTCKKQIDSDL